MCDIFWAIVVRPILSVNADYLLIRMLVLSVVPVQLFRMKELSICQAMGGGVSNCY